MKRIAIAMITVFFLAILATPLFSGEKELFGVKFPGEKRIGGKILTLNGIACRKAFGIIKVYVAGLYLEKPTTDPEEVVESEQVKYLETRYLTKKATAKKLREGFVDLMEKCNSPEMVKDHRAEIDLYASWLDKDMAPGLTSSSLYIPGKGITLTYQGIKKGTIRGGEFARMYYNYNVGEKANKKIKKGLLGIE